MTNPPFPEPPAADSSTPTTPPAAPPAPPTAAPAYPAPTAPAYPQPEPTPPGRVLSIVGLVLAFLAAPIGLILSIVAAVKLGKTGQPKGLAIAGIIIGAILTILGIIGIILSVTVFAAIFGTCAELGAGVWEVNGVTYTCG
ncbi:DUF4190 domain-containing protein [Microbacterium oxydans]|jgi:hypothetical protein|uniref:DUF4190 domain-containing protein n=2 Tax=Microbacterium TaxID=33882 RepID=UPI001141AB8C|nr:DUF4190 domain-containing protein [Microbacterium oxydans]KAB1889456.1 DUF4190 domain-containing protein [Microbacterium oxydans]GED39813.1 hypothetical protein MOX01_29550 [Microbacterium oxydans]